jgi:hypothetical protein
VILIPTVEHLVRKLREGPDQKNETTRSEMNGGEA